MERRKRIALIMPEIIDPSDYELIQGVHSQARYFGLDVVILTGIFNSQIELQQDDYIHALENIYSLIGNAEVDGILFASERFRNQPLIRRIREHLEKRSIPSLALGDNGGTLQTLHARQRESMYQVTKHLIANHRCKSIWCITGTPDSRASAERTAGFRDAMAEAGLPVQENRIFYGNFWREIPAQIGQKIVSGELESPDAVVCASDVMALALIEALQEGGIRVPEDIAVTGYDGGWFSLFRGLTTVAGRDQQFGADAVCKLCGMMGMNAPEYSDRKQSLRIRTSCGCSEQKTEWTIGFSLEQQFENKILHMMHNQEFLISNLIERFSAVHSLEDWIVQADKSAHILCGVQGLDLCLCSDWMMDFDHPDVFRQHSFSDTMFLALSKRPGQNADDQYSFPVRQITPAFEKTHEPFLAVLTSLSLGTQVMGYVAAYYEKVEDIQLDESYVNWCDAAANGLNFLQKHLHRQNMQERIAHLSLRNPATGFLNRRGLAEILPDYLEAHQKNGGQVWLTAMGCGTDSAAGYDTALLLANSLRDCVPEGAILCHCEERSFLLLSDWETPDIPTKAEVKMAELLQLQPPEVISISKPLQNGALSEQIMEIQRCMDELRQKIEHSSSYTSDYRQALHRMRLRITDQPQHDWSLEEIAKEIGISVSHLQRLYRELFGTTITEDVIAARITMAEYLLLHTELRITEIAAECGYKSETHFMRQFKKRKAMTPTQFREQG